MKLKLCSIFFLLICESVGWFEVINGQANRENAFFQVHSEGKLKFHATKDQTQVIPFLNCKSHVQINEYWRRIQNYILKKIHRS